MSENTKNLPAEVYYVYRSITPVYFEKNANKPRPTAFHRRESEAALSVWAVEQVTPRQVLQKYLDGVLADLQSKDENAQRKAQNRLNANGATPEEMYDKGWRVVRLSENVFSTLGLFVAEPRDDGHRDVIGSVKDFQVSAFALGEASVVLTQQDTLRSQE